MAELTLAQKKALALASARLRVQKNAAPQQEAQPEASVLPGLAKAAGAGVAEGVIGLPGAIGDVSQLNQSLLSRGAEAVGLPEWAQRGAAMGGKLLMGPFGNMPNTSQITEAVEGVTGPLYKPQNVGEEYARTAGQFAPAALLGPGRLASKAATAGTSALLSETAGQATKGTEAEPYARLGGALLGGGRYGSPKKAALKSAPSQAQVAAQTKAAYDKLRSAGIKYDAIGYQQFSDDLQRSLIGDGIDPVLHPKASRALELVAKEAGGSPDFQKLDNLRKIAGDVLKSPEAAERRMAGVILAKLDEFANNSALISNGSVPAGKVAQLASQARELGRRNIIARDLGEMDRKAEFYVSGDESGMRNQIASYAKSAKGKYLTAAEKKAFKKVVRREGLYNLLTTAGGRLNLTVGPSAGALLGSTMGPLGTAAGAAAGIGTHLLSRKVMEKVSQKALEDARRTVLLGKKGQSKIKGRSLVGVYGNAPRLGLLGSASQAGDR